MDTAPPSGAFDDEDDGFDFKSLPFDLQNIIFKKFCFEDYGKFDQLSRFSHSFCESSTVTSFKMYGNELEFKSGRIRVYKGEAKTQAVMLNDVPRNVMFHVERIKVGDNYDLSEEIVNFLLERTRGVEILCMYEHKDFGPLFTKLYKGIKPKSVVIDEPKFYESLPTDFSDSQVLNYIAALSLKPSKMFQIKIQSFAQLRGVLLTYDQLLEQIDLWKSGQINLNHMLIIQNLIGFTLPDFVDGMRNRCECHELKEDRRGLTHKWRVVRVADTSKEMSITYTKLADEPDSFYISPKNWNQK